MNGSLQSRPATLEAALRELEQIVTSLETHTEGLETRLRQYLRGDLLLRYCRETLLQAERQLEEAHETDPRDLG